MSGENWRLVWATIAAVFMICIGVRMFFISEKDELDGDEHTSLVLAYNVAGWGDKSYEAYHAYTAKELSQMLYVDDVPGWRGYCDDMASLWRNNRDGSHASLYYMLLRTAMAGQNSPQLRNVVNRGCGLNLLLFAVSFWCLAALLLRLLPGKGLLCGGLLAFAYMNPIAVSVTLLMREYQLAECLFAVFAVVAFVVMERIRNGKPIFGVRLVAVVSLVVALLVSSGYFNAFFALFVAVCLFVASRRKLALRQLWFFPSVVAMALVLCLLLYRGYFDFLGDVRMSEVAGKAKGDDFVQNLYYSMGSLAKVLLYRMSGECLMGLSAVLLAAVAVRRKPLGVVPGFWLFACVLAWIVVVAVFSTWKEPRYISPGVPLAMAFAGYYVFEMARTFGGKSMAVQLLALLLLFVNIAIPGRVEYLHGNGGQLPPANRFLLYAKDAETRNSLALFAEKLQGSQEIVIVERMSDIAGYALKEDSVAYVFADWLDTDFDGCRDVAGKVRYSPWLYEYTVKVR